MVKGKKGKIIIISGPSGSGKTTLYKKLLEQKINLVKSISVTTRPRREGEVHKRDYIFVTPKMFEYKKRAGHFLESERVFDNSYGTPGKNVRDLINSGVNVLLCIDVKGAKKVLRRHKKAVKIFIKTPSMDILQKRLKARASEDTETIDLRIKTAKEELKEAKDYDHIIINDRLDRAFKELKTIVDGYVNE